MSYECTGLNGACYLAMLVEWLYWTTFHATRVRTISACRVNAGKTALYNVDSFDLQLRNDKQYFDEIFRKRSAQAWRTCLQNFVVRKWLLWKP